MTVVEVPCERAPQPGEHDVPLAVRLQVTPLLLESFCTVAVNTMAAVPAWTEVTLFVIATEILLPPFPLPEPAPQPASKSTKPKIDNQQAFIRAVGADSNPRLLAITLLQVRGSDGLEGPEEETADQSHIHLTT